MRGAVASTHAVSKRCDATAVDGVAAAVAAAADAGRCVDGLSIPM